MATIVRPTITDDDGSGTTGTVLNAAFFGDVFDKIDALHSPKRCLAYHSTTQTISNATWTAMLFDSEDSDPSAMHSTVSNTNRITIPTGAGGLYLLTAVATFAANATGIRGLGFYKNNAVLSAATELGSSGASLGTYVTHTVLAVLADADYVEARCYQSSGGDLAVGGVARQAQTQFQLVQLA